GRVTPGDDDQLIDWLRSRKGGIDGAGEMLYRTHALAAADDQDKPSVWSQAELAAQRRAVSRRIRVLGELPRHRQATHDKPPWRHTKLKGPVASLLSRHDHTRDMRVVPGCMAAAQVSHHGNVRRLKPQSAHGPVNTMVEQRVNRDDHIGRMLTQQA